MLKKFTQRLKAFGSVPTNGWWPWKVSEAYSGAWQQNVEYSRETVMAHFAVFSCTTLIASDIAKLYINMKKEDSNGIWSPTDDGVSAILHNPNSYQNRIQFIESWINSKLTRGNAYILKVRNGRNGKITALHVMKPDFVLPLVTPEGDVYYQLGQDNLSGVKEAGITVPASEIIHDRFNCLFHPLVGLPPIYASGLAAFQGLKMQENSALFFKNMSRPSGLLIAPGAISQETATRLKESFETLYSGTNFGRVAALGDGLKYEPLSVTAAESQMIEQLKLTGEIVCATYHVPPYKVLSAAPSYNNIEALEQTYYSQCLQRLIEDLELCLDRGLEAPEGTGIEFDLDCLLRMDTKTQLESLKVGVGASIYSPDEARKKLNLPPVPGGKYPLSQQQYYSLEALAKRDAKEDPFAGNTPSPTPDPVTDPAPEDDNSLDYDPEQNKAIAKAFEKEFGLMQTA